MGLFGEEKQGSGHLIGSKHRTAIEGALVVSLSQ
jgi:hypothetical protein